MHTAFRITNGEPGASYHQRSRMYRYQPGNRQKEEKKTAAGRNSNDFLMGRILPIRKSLLFLPAAVFFSSFCRFPG